MKIKICCPVYNQLTWDNSLAKSCVRTISKQKRDFDFNINVIQSTIIEEARNVLISNNYECQMIKQKLDENYTHWLFIDHDVGFTLDNLNKLLNHKKDIISGSYRPKDKPERFVAGWCDDNGKIMEYVPAIDKGLIEVDWTGGGFLLCTREALEKMDYPWYWKSVHIYGNRALTVGEDVYFCLNARSNLLTIHLDTSCILNHEANRYCKIEE